VGVAQSSEGQSSLPAAARACDATKHYGTSAATVTALDSVSVDFESGRFSTIMGPSGSGKSTLLHCLSGLDTLDSGRVHIGATDLSRLSERELTELRRTQVGFVFQGFNLLATLSARENIELPAALTGYVQDRTGYDYLHHAEVGSSNAAFVGDEVTDRFCVLGSVADHIAKLRQLAEAGVDQFNIYLMNGDEEAVLETYGREIIPVLRDVAPARA